MAAPAPRTEYYDKPPVWETLLGWLCLFVLWPVVLALLVYAEVIGNLETAVRYYQVFGWDETWKKIKGYRLFRTA